MVYYDDDGHVAVVAQDGSVKSVLGEWEPALVRSLVKHVDGMGYESLSFYPNVVGIEHSGNGQMHFYTAQGNFGTCTVCAGGGRLKHFRADSLVHLDLMMWAAFGVSQPSPDEVEWRSFDGDDAVVVD